MLSKDKITAAVAAGFGGRVVETGLCDTIVEEIMKLQGKTDLDVEAEYIKLFQRCTDSKLLVRLAVISHDIRYFPGKYIEMNLAKVDDLDVEKELVELYHTADDNTVKIELLAKIHDVRLTTGKYKSND